jgi:ABC-type amino acid transport substrate-binding protein
MTQQSQRQTVYYGGYQRQDYYTELLQLALSYPNGKDYQLKASGLDLPKQRAFDLMNAHGGIDVLFGSVNADRLKRYRGIPFGLLRGYNGWRVALVNRNTPDVLRGIHSKQHLRRLTAGQFLTWSDTEILRSNDLTVETSSDINGLYGMLQRGRIDYFPLSVLEVAEELAKHPDPQLMIDPHLLLIYPTATWFYVAKDNNALADALLQGLQQAKRDGSFDRLFQRYFGTALQQLKLDSRSRVLLDNPQLPAGILPAG